MQENIQFNNLDQFIHNLFNQNTQQILNNQSKIFTQSQISQNTKPTKLRKNKRIRMRNTIVSNFQQSSVHNLILQEQQKPQKFDKQIINQLFSQNIDGINPYLEILNQIYSNQEKYSNKKKIQELCYMGIGKNIVSFKKKEQPPYNRVNILIRQFMVEIVQNELQVLQKLNPNVIYLMCNSHALGFKKTNFNSSIQQYMSIQTYHKIINDINKTIENNFLDFKNKKFIKISQYTIISFVFILISIFILIFYAIIINNFYLIYAFWIFLLVGITVNLIGVFKKEKQYHIHKNIIDRIQDAINQYFNKINLQNKACSKNYRLKCGRDFYWIQIHKIENKNILSPQKILETQQAQLLN